MPCILQTLTEHLSKLPGSTSYIPNMHQGFINFFRYKPIIIFEIGAYWTTWALLVWANGVAWMKFMQFTFGLASATEVAYYTYMYAQVCYAKSETHYPKLRLWHRVGLFNFSFDRFGFCDPRLFKSWDYLSPTL